MRARRLRTTSTGGSCSGTSALLSIIPPGQGTKFGLMVPGARIEVAAGDGAMRIYE